LGLVKLALIKTLALKKAMKSRYKGPKASRTGKNVERIEEDYKMVQRIISIDKFSVN